MMSFEGNDCLDFDYYLGSKRDELKGNGFCWWGKKVFSQEIQQGEFPGESLV